MLSCEKILQAGASRKGIRFQLHSVQFTVTLDPKREFSSVWIITGPPSRDVETFVAEREGGGPENRVVSCE